MLNALCLFLYKAFSMNALEVHVFSLNMVHVFIYTSVQHERLEQPCILPEHAPRLYMYVCMFLNLMWMFSVCSQ